MVILVLEHSVSVKSPTNTIYIFVLIYQILMKTK